MSVPAANLIRLRQLLGEKFPGLRTRADLPAQRADRWPTTLPQLDDPLGGGFPRSALTEIVAPRHGCGSALLLASILERAVAVQQFAALIDGQDSFDAACIPPGILARVLWMRCRAADEAVKATDLVLRDGNLPLVLLDLALNPEAQLRKIPGPTWYRFQRIVEEGTAVFVVVTPRAMISAAQRRVTIESRFTLAALEVDRSQLVRHLEVEGAARHFGRGTEPLRRSA